jgi:anthranilate synthase/aminodeoxychorismate synthase-like glutamine amidotransferase
MVLLLDNYDSFTYNLAQYLGELGSEIRVVRSDAIRLADVDELGPERIVISPGPRTPSDAGISMDVVRHVAGRIPLLGVCLGHQTIGQAFGGAVVRAPAIMHGKTSRIHHDGKTIFRGLQNPLTATRYHSLVVERDTLPDCLQVSAATKDGVIMGLRHRAYLLEGVQFHPESILTIEGKHLLRNFLELGPDRRCT